MPPRVVNGKQLQRWRESRDWSQRRAAMWAGCHTSTWANYEGAGPGAFIPRWLELRIAELRWQERLLTHVRNEILRHQAGQVVDFGALVTLLEGGATPDPEQLRRAPGLWRFGKRFKARAAEDPDAGDSEGVYVLGESDPLASLAAGPGPPHDGDRQDDDDEEDAQGML